MLREDSRRWARSRQHSAPFHWVEIGWLRHSAAVVLRSSNRRLPSRADSWQRGSVGGVVFAFPTCRISPSRRERDNSRAAEDESLAARQNERTEPTDGGDVLAPSG